MWNHFDEVGGFGCFFIENRWSTLTSLTCSSFCLKERHFKCLVNMLHGIKMQFIMRNNLVNIELLVFLCYYYFRMKIICNFKPLCDNSVLCNSILR